MKIINAIIVLFPFFTLAMQGPVTHTTKDALSKSEYSWAKISGHTGAELEWKIDSLMMKDEFVKELPTIISDAEAQSALLEKKIVCKQCCTFGKFMAATCLTGCVATYVIKTINNVKLAELICAIGTGAASYQCKSELQANNHQKREAQEKIALLKRFLKTQDQV